MMSVEDWKLVHQIADRAVRLYEKFGVQVDAQYIVDEIRFVHTKIVPLRLSEFATSDDNNFAHDIGGIHQHLSMRMSRLEDGFYPRFAKRGDKQ